MSITLKSCCGTAGPQVYSVHVRYAIKNRKTLVKNFRMRRHWTAVSGVLIVGLVVVAPLILMSGSHPAPQETTTSVSV